MNVAAERVRQQIAAVLSAWGTDADLVRSAAEVMVETVCQLGVGVWRFDANMLPTHLVYSENPHHHHLANVAFGGPDRRTLYITESLSGDILMAKLPVAGKLMYGLS